MSARVFGPRSFSGHPLGEGDLVRYIYCDEGGTSAVNEVSVVAGVIAKPDEHWRKVHERLEALKQLLPEQLREGFVFSAKEIYGAEVAPFTDKKEWPIARRVSLICSLLSIVREERAPVAIGYVRRGKLAESATKKQRIERVRREHEVAFLQCARIADDFLRHLAPTETATLVIEMHSDMDRRIKNVFDAMKAGRSPIMNYKVTQIVDAAFFQDKKDAPLLQLADCCAWAFQRYFAHKPHMGQFMLALSGKARPLSRHDDLGGTVFAIGQPGSFAPLKGGQRSMTFRQSGQPVPQVLDPLDERSPS